MSEYQVVPMVETVCFVHEDNHHEWIQADRDAFVEVER